MSRLTCLTIVIALCTCRAASAGQFCILETPSLQTTAGGIDVVVTVKCSAAAGDSALPYPDGTLYVGATVFRADPGLKGKTLPFDSWKDDERMQPTHLPAVEVRAVSGPIKATFHLPQIGANTHISIAVWDQKNACKGQSDCPEIGYTLGRADDDGMPIPIDTWPRPVCRKAKLIASGYLTSSGPVDPSGHVLEGSAARDFLSNDCYRLVKSDGLGYSLRRWRIGPLPTAQ